MRPLLLIGVAFLAARTNFAQDALTSLFTPRKAPPTTDYLAAFNRIPDSGTVCSITILVEKAWDPLSGHAFIQLSKSNGHDSVVQYVGFYRVNPKQGLFSDEPVPAKLSDDAYHAYHASLRRQITAADLRSVLQELQHLSTARYQTVHFNSVDFALRLMDRTGITNPLLLAGRSSTPGGLYRLLKRRKKQTVDPAETISIARGTQYAGGDNKPMSPLTALHHP
jgi:hypothetical protein